MNNVSTINLPVSTFGNVDDILVNASGSAGRIKKVDFLGAMNDWSNVMNKPFDNFDNAYFRTKERADGADILTLSDSVIAYFQTIGDLQTEVIALDSKVDENLSNVTSLISETSANLSNQIVNTNTRVTTLEGKSHTHNNKAVIDLFSTSGSKLLWNGTAVGSDYELPIATSSVLGGVKPDGITITVDSNGTIHGASQGLDFDALSTAMTTGTQSGISITADAENSRFNFEVTGMPTIAIDSDGYWTVNGDKGTHPTKAQGEKGNDGVSPTASVTKTETGATITITDSSSTTTVDISNGIDGKDGISPHIDESTNHWFVGEIDTGIGATASIDDTSTDGTDVSWSASKIKTELNNINTSLNYSTEEQVIGTWIDGSPIYQKTIVFDVNTFGRWTQVSLGDESYNVISHNSYIQITNSTTNLPIPTYRTSNSFSQILFTPTTVEVYIASNDYFGTCYSTIRYTKK